jgi:epoxyqueuosine reductase
MSAVLSSAELSQLASSVGFDDCGFARAEPIPAETLTAWLEAGMDADMDWMAERAADRLDVSRLLPGAQTVIAFACNYQREEELASPIARYARGRDYHYTMQDRLRAFRRGLVKAHPGVKSYSTVDTGPVMEKVWAARAGLGYVGRNGCLITEKFGSFVVLSVMVIDLTVDRYASGPAMDRCGSCSLCVSACPTMALDGEGRVDARRCLSYQTIENREVVPEELRSAFEGIVFGCDICQDVCPLNDVPVLNASDRFAPRAVSGLSVREIAAMTKEQYDQLVRGTALGRAKYDGLRRNAAYALGAARARDAAPLLRQLSTDSSELVRDAAQWALARISENQ